MSAAHGHSISPTHSSAAPASYIETSQLKRSSTLLSESCKPPKPGPVLAERTANVEGSVVAPGPEATKTPQWPPLMCEAVPTIPPPAENVPPTGGGIPPHADNPKKANQTPRLRAQSRRSEE